MPEESAVEIRRAGSVSPGAVSLTPVTQQDSGARSGSPNGVGADGRLSSVMDFGGDVDSVLIQAFAARYSTSGGGRPSSGAWGGRGGAGAKIQGGGTPGGQQLLGPPRATGVSAVGRSVSPAPSGAVSTATPSSSPSQQAIPLTHLSVELTIALRDVYDRFSTVEAGPGGHTSQLNEGVQMTTVRNLDIFSVTALLHHSQFVNALPPENELRRIILRVAVANAQMTAKSIPSGAHNVGGPAVEAVLEFPTTLTFSIFLQIVELVKRWSLRGEDEDEASKAFQFLHRNRRYIRPADEVTIRGILGGSRWPSTGTAIGSGLLSAQSNALTPQQGALGGAAGGGTTPGMLDLDQPLDLSMSRPQGASAAGNIAASAGINVKVLSDMLAGAGAAYDFQTLFRSVDPTFEDHKGTRIDLRQFRWIAGEDDPDIVKAFVSLGGEEGLSGTITIDKLIAKCEAMQMTPQYIANFVALVDANQDGVVDFTEFLSLLVRNRQELTGERRAKLTDRSGMAASAFRFARGSSSSKSTGGGGAGGNSTSLPFPRYKRFSRAEPGDPRRTSLPFQGGSRDDDDDDEDGSAGGEGRADEDAGPFAFQKKVQRLFEAPEIITIEEDESLRNTGRDGAADDDCFTPRADRVTGTPFRDGDGATLEDSFSSDDLDATKQRQARRRLSKQETHLGIGLSGMLQGAQHSGQGRAEQKREKSNQSLSERISAVVKRGTETIALHRGKVQTVMQDLEKRQRKLIRTDDGLVEGNRETGESAVQQRQRLRKTRQEHAAARRAAVTISPRLAALSNRACVLLEKDVKAMLAAQVTTDSPAADSSKPSNETVPTAQGTPAAATVASQPGMASASVTSKTPAQSQTVTAAPMPQVKTAPNVDASSRLSNPHRTHRTQLAVTQLQQQLGEQIRLMPTQQPKPPVSADAAQPLVDTIPLHPAVTPMSLAPRGGSHLSVTSDLAARGEATGSRLRSSSSCRTPQVKLEDPAALWKLLEANHRRMERERDIPVAVGAAERDVVHPVRGVTAESSTSAANASLLTRRVFARTIASHLALRLPYDDNIAAFASSPSRSMGARTIAPPATGVAHTYLLGAPQPRRPLSGATARRPQSTADPPTQSHSTKVDGAAAASHAQPPSQEGNSTTARPHRPQTAPSSRRPMSARSTARAVQLSRPTNISPSDHSLAPPAAAKVPFTSASLSRPSSATCRPDKRDLPSSLKQYGVGGALDVEEDDDDGVVEIV